MKNIDLFELIRSGFPRMNIHVHLNQFQLNESIPKTLKKLKLTELKLFAVVFSLIFISDVIYSTASEHPTSYNYIKQSFDVIRYDLDAEFTNVSLKEIRGKNQITLKWEGKSEQDIFYFHLLGLNVDSVFYNNKSIEFDGLMTDNTLDFRWEILRPAEDDKDTAVITIFYSGRMISEGGKYDWGGVHFSNNILFNMGVGFYNPNVSGGRYWMPCFDHPSDKAKFSAKFTVPTELTVASVGLLKSVKELGKSRKIYEWEHNFECATYLMNFAVSDFIVLHDTTEKKIPVTIYSFESDSLASSLCYQNVDKMVECFEQNYTNYPYDKVGYVNAPIGAMEHQTMITMPRSVILNSAGSGNFANETVAHELSHSWFGNLVTPKDFRDAWFNESFCTFSEAVWLDYAFKQQIPKAISYSQKIAKDWNEYLKNISIAEGLLPLYNFKNYEPVSKLFDKTVSNYPTTIYVKGSVIVQLLRYKIGDSLFFGALKNILNKYAYKNINTQELKQEFELFSGKDLTNFFDQWIYQKGYPVLSINYKIKDNNIEMDVKQTQDENKYGKYNDIVLPAAYIFSDTIIRKNYSVTENQQKFNESFPDLSKFIRIDINRNDGLISPLKYSLQLVSVNDETANQSIRLFYNMENIYLECSKPENSISFYLADVLGNVIYENNNFNMNIGRNELLNISNLTSGCYFAFLQMNGKVINEKIIIAK